MLSTMMSRSSFVFIISFLIAAVAIHRASGFERRRILFRRCEEGITMPHVVYMNCANSYGSCELRKWSTHTLRAIFRPTINSSSVHSEVSWRNGWFNLPLPNQENNACLNIQCPVKANEISVFTYNLEISNLWPEKEFPVEWILSDEDTGEDVVCFRFKVSIV